MPCCLEPPIRVGAFAVTAVVRQQITPQNFGVYLQITGHKEPVAFVWMDGAELRVVRPDGVALTEQQLENLCPGAVKTVRTG